MFVQDNGNGDGDNDNENNNYKHSNYIISYKIDSSFIYMSLFI